MHAKEFVIGKKKAENGQMIAYEIMEEPVDGLCKVLRIKDEEVLIMPIEELIDPYLTMLEHKFGGTHEFLGDLSIALNTNREASYEYPSLNNQPHGQRSGDQKRGPAAGSRWMRWLRWF